MVSDRAAQLSGPKFPFRQTAASLIGRLGQVHFMFSFPSFGSLSLIRVTLLFAVIVGPVRLDRCMHVSDWT